LNPVHEEVLEIPKISVFVLTGLGDSESDGFVVVEDFMVINFWKCSKQSNDMLAVFFKLIGTMWENKDECFGVSSKDNLPVSRVADFLTSNWWPKLELNFTNLLSLVFIKSGGMHG